MSACVAFFYALSKRISVCCDYPGSICPIFDVCFFVSPCGADFCLWMSYSDPHPGQQCLWLAPRFLQRLGVSVSVGIFSVHPASPLLCDAIDTCKPQRKNMVPLRLLYMINLGSSDVQISSYNPVSYDRDSVEHNIYAIRQHHIEKGHEQNRQKKRRDGRYAKPLQDRNKKHMHQIHAERSL